MSGGYENKLNDCEEREGDGCIGELGSNVQGENKESQMDRKRLGQTKLRKRARAHLNTMIPKEAQSSGGCGRREPKGAACAGRCVVARRPTSRAA